MYLIHLDSRVNKHRCVEDADTNDLDGVFQSKRIVTEDHKKQMREDEQGEVSRSDTELDIYPKFDCNASQAVDKGKGEDASLRWNSSCLRLRE